VHVCVKKCVSVIMVTREDTQYALEMKKQHQRVMLADVIEGFRKMRFARISEEQKARESRKAEAESMIRALLDQEGVPVVGVDGVMTTPSKSKRRGGGVGGGGGGGGGGWGCWCCGCGGFCCWWWFNY
jgi:hypothetical protein